MKEIQKAKYKEGDVVAFQCFQAIKKGIIAIVDAHGTFFQAHEPSYDILVTDDPFGQNALYKHIQQSWILPTTDVEVTKFQEEQKEESDKDWDEHVRQVGKDLVQKHIGALKELAKWD